MKIIGIDNILNVTEIEQDINQRNFNNVEEKCKVLHTYANQKSKTVTAIIEVTPQIYKQIRENKNRIFVGYQNCRVFDIINTNPCSKCARYGHSGNKCRNEATCSKCAGNHTAVQCKSETYKCPNCEHNNIKYKTNYNTNHSALDSEQCSILKNKIKKYIESVDYPIEPTFQRFFGKVERPRPQMVNEFDRTDIRRARVSNKISNGATTSPKFIIPSANIV